MATNNYTSILNVEVFSDDAELVEVNPYDEFTELVYYLGFDEFITLRCDNLHLNRIFKNCINEKGVSNIKELTNQDDHKNEMMISYIKEKEYYSDNSCNELNTLVGLNEEYLDYSRVSPHLLNKICESGKSEFVGRLVECRLDDSLSLVYLKFDYCFNDTNGTYEGTLMYNTARKMFCVNSVTDIGKLVGRNFTVSLDKVRFIRNDESSRYEFHIKNIKS